MKRYLYFLFVLITCSSNAQTVRPYFHVNLGISQKQLFYYGSHSDPAPKNSWQVSWKYGNGVSVAFYNNFFFETGILFSRINQKEVKYAISSASIASSTGTITIRGQSTTTTKLRSYNLGVPISLKYQYKKLGFKVGVQLLYELRRTGNNHTLVIFDIPYINNETKEEYEFPIKKISQGFLSGLSYELTKMISLEIDVFLSGFQGFSDPDAPSPRRGNRKNRQITTGLSFYF